MADLNTLIDMKKKYTDTLKAEAEPIVKESFRAFFDANPTIEAVRWTQYYTPSFNDGDACVFGLHGVYFKVIGGKEDEGDEGDGFVSDYNLEGETRTAADRLERSLGEAKDALEIAFGDHAKVTVTREKIDVTEYDGDY